MKQKIVIITYIYIIKKFNWTVIKQLFLLVNSALPIPTTFSPTTKREGSLLNLLKLIVEYIYRYINMTARHHKNRENKKENDLNEDAIYTHEKRVALKQRPSLQTSNQQKQVLKKLARARGWK